MKKGRISAVLFGLVLSVVYGVIYIKYFEISNAKAIVDFEAVSIFTNQIGAYANIEKMEETKGKLKDEIASFNQYSKDGLTFLLSIITLSREESEAQKTKLNELGYNVIVKEYKIQDESIFNEVNQGSYDNFLLWLASN